MVVLVTCRNKLRRTDQKWRSKSGHKVFPHYNPMGAICCHGNRSSDPIWPFPPQWCFRWNLITFGQLVSDIFMFESVDGRTDARTPARVPSYKRILSLRLWWAKNILDTLKFVLRDSSFCEYNVMAPLLKKSHMTLPISERATQSKIKYRYLLVSSIRTMR